MDIVYGILLAVFGLVCCGGFAKAMQYNDHPNIDTWTLGLIWAILSFCLALCSFIGAAALLFPYPMY